MSFGDWLFAPIGGERHAAAADGGTTVQVLSDWKTARAIPAPHDYRALLAEGYAANVIVYACVNEIATSVAEPDLICRRIIPGGDDVELPSDHPLVQLFERPNEDQDQFEFLEELVVQFAAAGEAAVYKLRNPAGSVRGLQVLRSDYLEPIASKTGRVIRYEYTIDGQRSDDLDPRNVAFIRRPNPLHPLRGLSPIGVAATAIDADNMVMQYIRQLFSNGGVPRGLLKLLKSKTTAEERESIQSKWKDKYGRGRWAEVAVVDEDVEYQSLGIKPDEGAFGEQFGVTESRICAAFGVPPILIAAKVGIDAATYSNYGQARRSFWEETLTPMFTRVAARLTHTVAHEFGDDLYTLFDLAKVQALQEGADARSTRAREEWKAGLVTKNEAREDLGRSRLVGGDVLRADMQSLEEPAEAENMRDVRAIIGPSSEIARRIEALVERAENETQDVTR